MEGEIIALSRRSSKTNTSVKTLSILVVDDDSTCLSIVSAILKKWNYEVVTVKHPMDALCTLRIKCDSFDLVVTDIHMPDMNGFELQQKIVEEFKLPVVLMSADDEAFITLKGVQSGAAFFMLKPLCPEDLRDLWQYAISKEKGTAIFVDAGSAIGKSVADIGSDEDIESALTANEDREVRKDSKRKPLTKDDKEEENVHLATSKKAKVVWTNELHDRFLKAIKSIGLERAVPKKILELMKVPGLTRENVASHLQKYRIFLRRVSEASYRIHVAGEKVFESNFMPGNHKRMLSELQQQQMRPSFHGRVEGHVPIINSSNFFNVSSSYQKPSSGNSLARSISGQSRLLSDQADVWKLKSGNGNPFYQANCSSLIGVRPNSSQAGLFLHGVMSSGFMTGTNSMRMYQPQMQVTPKSIATCLSNYDSTPFGVCGSNIYSALMNGIQNVNATADPMLCRNGHLAQEENTSLPLQQPTPTPQNNCDNGGEDDNQFGSVNNFYTFNYNFHQLPFDQGDIDCIFSSLNNTQSENQQDNRNNDPDIGSSGGSYHIEDNPLTNYERGEQQDGGEEVVGSSFCSGPTQPDDYLSWFSQQSHGGLEDSEELSAHLLNSIHPSTL